MARRKNPAAVALGKRGAKARLKKLTPEERSAIARKAGLAGGRGKEEGRLVMDTWKRSPILMPAGMKCHKCGKPMNPGDGYSIEWLRDEQVITCSECARPAPVETPSARQPE